MKKNHLLWFLVALCGLAFAVHAGEGSYKKTLKKWTRTDEVYKADDFHAVIIWSATILNDRMLSAQAEKYAKAYNVGVSERDEIFEKLEKKREGGTLFFVSFYSYDRKFNDLADKRAGWDLRLEAGDSTFRPLHIEKINKPTPLDLLYFPYFDQWSTGYYVRFPAEAGMQVFPWTLAVHGPKAHSTLVWK